VASPALRADAFAATLYNRHGIVLILLRGSALLRWLVLATATLAASVAAAQRPELPLSLAEGALAEQVPGAFAPTDFETDDFELLPVAGNDPTIRARLEPGSLRWVRTARLVVVPRAVAVIETQLVTAGSVRHAGFAHPLVLEDKTASASVPVALLSSESATIDVEAVRDGRIVRAVFAVRFRPRSTQVARVLIDSSCSPYGVSVRSGRVPDDSWLYVGCRMVRTGHRDHRSPTLELYLLWDHVGSSIEINGIPSGDRPPGLFTHRVGARPGRVMLAANKQVLELGYFVPDPLHAAFVGAGLGPALYTFDGPGSHVETVLPLLTLYAGYSFDATTRLVYFSAVAAHRRGYIGQGLYLWFEQFRAFDDRLSMNVLLGANLLIYRRGNGSVARVNAPQGVEFIMRDFAAVNRNLTVGAFLYPDIGGSGYYDGWVRWGSPRFFGELNFLYWREPHSTGSTRSQTLGLSFGMPLLRFL